jgi:hypothetical protein
MVRHSVQGRWIVDEPIAAATRGMALNPITKPVMTRQPPSNLWRGTKHQPRGLMIQPARFMMPAQVCPSSLKQCVGQGHESGKTPGQRVHG